MVEATAAAAVVRLGGLRMVASQLLLMNHFLLSLSQNTADLGAFSDINSVTIDTSQCSYGCTVCSPINGCLACKPPFFMSMQREGVRQIATCTRTCPKGFYKLKKKRNGFCAKCTMRGCLECLDSRYCSSCDSAFINFFGKCIKQRPEGGREELGIYTTTRKPIDYYVSYGVGFPMKANGTTLTPEVQQDKNSSAVATTSSSQYVTPATTVTSPSSPAITSTTEAGHHNSESSMTGDRVPPVDLGTRFYFTTPTSPILSENSAPSIYPYPSETPIHQRAPCRKRGERRPWRTRGQRKNKRGRGRGRRKKERDRKYRRRRRRRKGKRGDKGWRKRCQDKEELLGENNGSNLPSSQDPAIRHLNSAEPIDEVSQNHTAKDLSHRIDSALDESNSSTLNQDGWTKDHHLPFRNRPKDLADFKRTLVMQRKNSELLDTANHSDQNNHRIRHGRSRYNASKRKGAGSHRARERKLRNKAGKRSRRRYSRREQDRPDQFPFSFSIPM